MWPRTVRADVGQVAPSGVDAKFIQVHADADRLARIANQAASGVLRVTIARTYRFEEVAEAVERGREGRPGKAIVLMAQSPA